MIAFTRHLVAELEDDTTLNISLTWYSTDPYAVRMKLPPADDGQPVQWEFAWDLLEDGIQGPAGVGDVHVRPAIRAGYTEIVLYPGPRQLVLRLRTEDLNGFLGGTWAVEPPALPSYVKDIVGEMSS